MTLYPVARAVFDGAQLAQQHPPRFADENKKRIHAIACPAGFGAGGTLDASRWRGESFPLTVPDAQVALDSRAGIFDYPAPQVGTVAWHLNFADAHLFYAYGSGLFAQDEMQVAEHPILASLRESLVAQPREGFAPLTTEDDRPTPVLVMGAQRACAIVRERAGRSIYGNAMHRAHPDTLGELVTRLDPPSVTNILAIEALPGGSGRYTLDELRRVVLIATTGFAAARQESKRVAGPAAKAVIHTGHWGCGAYGGNRRLMALLQLVSARLAGIDRLVFYSFDASGQGAFDEALRHFNALVSPGAALEDVLCRIEELGFAWGTSDGN